MAIQWYLYPWSAGFPSGNLLKKRNTWHLEQQLSQLLATPWYPLSPFHGFRWRCTTVWKNRSQANAVNWSVSLYIKSSAPFRLFLHISVSKGGCAQSSVRSLLDLRLAPFIFLGILNILIVYRLHARHHTSIHRSMVSSGSTTGDPTVGTASTRKRQRQRNVDRNITFMLIAVAVAFMVMSFPYQ